MLRTIAEWHFTIQNCFINEKKKYFGTLKHIVWFFSIHWVLKDPDVQCQSFSNMTHFHFLECNMLSPDGISSIFQMLVHHFMQPRMNFLAVEVRKAAFLQLYVCLIRDFGVSEDVKLWLKLFLWLGHFQWLSPMCILLCLKFKAISYWAFMLCLIQ